MFWQAWITRIAGFSAGCPPPAHVAAAPPVSSRIDRIADPWGTRTPYGAGETWPARVDMHLEDGADPDRWTGWRPPRSCTRVVRIALAIRDVRDAEAALIDALATIGERHRDDHDATRRRCAA